MYKSLEQALLDLEKAGMLKRIHAEVDPHKGKFQAGWPGTPFRACQREQVPRRL